MNLLLFKRGFLAPFFIYCKMIEWGPFTFQHPIELPMFFLCIIFVVFMVFNLAMDDND